MDKFTCQIYCGLVLQGCGVGRIPGGEWGGEGKGLCHAAQSMITNSSYT